MYKIQIISCLFLLSGCSSVPTSTGVAIDLFDTEAFLDAEFDGISQKNITKTISYNDADEVIEIKDYDLTGDIDVLKQTNINNPSWTDKYTVDTLDLSDGALDIVYTSVDPKLKVQKLIVSSNQNAITGFEAQQKRDALISTSSKTIKFTSGQGYQISTTSKNLISPERRISIDVKF